MIDADRILEVTDNAESKVEAEVIDLSNYTVLPRLIDCHTHLTFEISKGRTTKDFIFSTDADHPIKATVYARRTLQAGFTTVRDVGGVNFIDVSLRKSINSGIVPGPRMFVATHIISITGGHGDFCSGFPPGLFPESTYRNGIINSPEEGVQAVRYAIKHGANHIKMAATGASFLKRKMRPNSNS